MNTNSMHHVTSITFEPVQHLQAFGSTPDSYYVRLIVTQQVPYTQKTINTEIVMHSDKPLRLGIPN